MTASPTGLLVERELGLSLRARWFVSYAGIFLLGGLFFTALGMGDTMVYGYRGFARAVASLVHLSLLFVPIMALIPSVAALADERETGALEYTLAQPVTFGQVYLGKWIGTGVAVVLSIAIGFGVSGALAVFRGAPWLLVTTMVGFVALIALAFVGLGFCLAALVASRGRALTMGLILWLAFAALGTLGVMAAFVRWGLPSDLLVAWSLLNPVEAFRLGVVSLLDPDMSVLGPVGARVVASLGASGTTLATAAVLAAWAVAPGIVGWFAFRHPRTHAG